jgi:hypothetical protein
MLPTTVNNVILNFLAEERQQQTSFSMPSLKELREHADRLKNEHGSDANFAIRVQNVVGEARSLHNSDAVKKARGAAIVVQAASQFNFLEFHSPRCVPESGISEYIFDKTQGPACAIACAAGTTYRNHLVPVPFPKSDGQEQTQRGQRGQTRNNQLNGLADVEEYLLRESDLSESPWTVKNGYVESSRSKLDQLNQLLAIPKSGDGLRETMIFRIRIALQENTTVTDDPLLNTQVTQTYNSAISIGYSKLLDILWEPVAQIVLDATYEATLLAGVLQSRPGATPPIIFLTMVGGGVFQNKGTWIRQAMVRAIRKVQKYGVSLDIRIVHFGSIGQAYIELETDALDTSCACVIL